jgi:hypothetical protein
MLMVCGCGQQAQQLVVHFPQESATNNPLEKGKATVSPVSHVSPANLPLVSEEGKTQAMQKLIGLDVMPKPSFAGPYRALTAEECRCRAAQASSMGNLLEREADLAPSHGRKADLQRALLQTASQEARNKDASAALELFYRLAEAEARWAVLAASIDQVKKAIAHGDKLRKQGLAVPPDLDQFTKQDFDLGSDRVRLEAGIEKLNRNLARKVEVAGVPEEERIWPVGDFSVAETHVDPAAAVSVGLAQRPELQLLRQASQEAGPGNLGTIDKLLSSSNALLGMSGGPLHKLLAILCKDEAGTRRDQLTQLQEQREREIADDIREAAQDMNFQVRLVILARARAKNAAAKLKEQEDKQAKGTGSVFDVASARLNWLKARDQQVREVTLWHIARTKLREAQGELWKDCEHRSESASAPSHIPVLWSPPMDGSRWQNRWTYSNRSSF